ncbi:helix-turn-helix transcriptional regulator [Paenibacillus oceani]|uniref:Helix-turn-helix transcriptional regulator n=1 Tax=Paenibacillus oceani TaxID=2772510 RepID=A0A927H185_9BACL|nr:AraC family transcriptional regulator [Paenibacillus oceani]MBD2864901.1 helix-turn-helix transcriptional regulator [Paenibacillus oceani]
MASFAMMVDSMPRSAFHSMAPNIHWAKRIHSAIYQIDKRRIYDFELLYVLKGEIQARVGEHAFLVPAGKLLYLPANVYHSIHFHTDLSFIGIHFDYFGEMTLTDGDEIVVNEAACNDNLFCTEPSLPFGPLFRQHLLNAPAETASMMDRIVDEFTAKKAGYGLVCRGLLLQILVMLLRDQDEAERQVHPVYGKTIVQLADRMEANCAADWSSHAISNELKLSPDYAAKVFKETIGVPPGRYIQQIRHQAAKKMLRETDATIETIGKQVGYDDLHYFNRIFHKLEGIPPGNYRKMMAIV